MKGTTFTIVYETGKVTVWGDTDKRDGRLEAVDKFTACWIE